MFEFSFLSDSQKQKLFAFYRELLEFHKILLIKEKEISRLMVDGVLSGRLLFQHISQGTIVDVGSGAGFPGIILAILSNRRKVVLIEPSQRRSEFLRHCVSSLGFQKRVEVRQEVFSLIQEKIVVFKAFAPLKKTLTQVWKYLPDQAFSYHFKGPGYIKEWDELSSKEKKNWKLKVLADYNFENQKRFILSIQKADHSPGFKNSTHHFESFLRKQESQ